MKLIYMFFIHFYFGWWDERQSVKGKYRWVLCRMHERVQNKFNKVRTKQRMRHILKSNYTLSHQCVHMVGVFAWIKHNKQHSTNCNAQTDTHTRAVKPYSANFFTVHVILMRCCRWQKFGNLFPGVQTHGDTHTHTHDDDDDIILIRNNLLISSNDFKFICVYVCTQTYTTNPMIT